MFDTLRSLITSFSQTRPQLAGIWRRVDDQFADCLVTIDDDDRFLQGRLTYVPAKMRQYGWKIGDIKWKNIRPRRFGQFSLDDLFLEFDADTKQLCKSIYREARILLISEKELVVRSSAWGGRSNRWVRSEKGQPACSE